MIHTAHIFEDFCLSCVAASVAVMTIVTAATLIWILFL